VSKPVEQMASHLVAVRVKKEKTQENDEVLHNSSEAKKKSPRTQLKPNSLIRAAYLIRTLKRDCILIGMIGVRLVARTDANASRQLFEL